MMVAKRSGDGKGNIEGAVLFACAYGFPWGFGRALTEGFHPKWGITHTVARGTMHGFIRHAIQTALVVGQNINHFAN